MKTLHWISIIGACINFIALWRQTSFSIACCVFGLCACVCGALILFSHEIEINQN